jgi:hypothetical protein
MQRHFKPGQAVIYKKPKRSTHPGMHAKEIYPAPHGEDYSYYVEKYWTVVAVSSGGTVVVFTRRGKVHALDAQDPALREAAWWERLLLRHRFPPVQPREGGHSDLTDSTAAVATATTLELSRT